MDFEEVLSQYKSFFDDKWNHFGISKTFRNFSNPRETQEWEVNESAPDSDPFYLLFRPSFYPNGNCKDNEGYVSCMFEFLNFIFESSFLRNIEFRCCVAIVDVGENKRFSQSFTYIFDTKQPQGIENGARVGLERYLKREVLLKDQTELLPDDCLTVSVEVDYILRICVVTFGEYFSYCPYDKMFDVIFYIDLDRVYGRELCRFSEFFRLASDTPMIEGTTRIVHIKNDELKAILHSLLILRQFDELRVDSIADICQLYVVADKYGIQLVLETCRQLIKGLFRTIEHAAKSLPAISELAETYNDDDDLKKTVQIYLESKKNFEANDYALEKHLKENLSTEWNCEFGEIDGWSYLKLSRAVVTEFEFYK